MLEPYQEMFDYVTEKSGLEIQKAKKAADLYIELLIQVSWKQQLQVPLKFFGLKFEFKPKTSRWTLRFLKDLSKLQFYIESNEIRHCN